jgi:hypothetical protein
MPIAIVEGDTGGTSTSQLAAYSAAKNKAAGDQTAQEQQIVAAVEASVNQAAQGWTDSGGTGGRQAAVALEVARFTADLEARRVAAVNQYATDASGGTLKARKAQSEMHGADTQTIVELARLVFELRERLNDSPY